MGEVSFGVGIILRETFTLTEQQTGANPKNVGGEGAAKLTGPEPTVNRD